MSSMKEVGSSGGGLRNLEGSDNEGRGVGHAPYMYTIALFVSGIPCWRLGVHTSELSVRKCNT